MVTDTHNQIGRNDKRLLWTVVAIIAAAILAYAVYASYYNPYMGSEISNTPTTTPPVTGTTANP